MKLLAGGLSCLCYFFQRRTEPDFLHGSNAFWQSLGSRRRWCNIFKYQLLYQVWLHIKSSLSNY